MTIAAPDDIGALPGLQDAFGQMLDHSADFLPARRLRRPQDGRHGQAGAGVIDVHRGKAALVMVCVPEYQLLPAVGRMERIVDVEDIAVRRCRARREVIDECARELRRVLLRRRIFEAADGRLRGERRSCLGRPADRHFQGGIVAKRILVDAVLVTAAVGEHARADDLAQMMAHARRIAPVGQRRSATRDDAYLLLRRP